MEKSMNIHDAMAKLEKIKSDLIHAHRWGVTEVQFCTDPTAVVRGSKYGPISNPTEWEVKREKDPEGNIVVEIFMYNKR
jgi:hypothetical protein